MRGGEDTVFEQEVDLLKKAEDIATLEFKNKSGWRGALQFFVSIWNIFSIRRVKWYLKYFQPEVIHLHNWHYALGPLIIRAAHSKKIPIVITLHNYRLLCPSATLYNKGSLFLDSLHVSFPWKSIRKRVYRDSYLQSFYLAFIIWIHKKIGTWKMVNRYIVLTDFAKNVFISSSFGISEIFFSVKPNFIKDPKLQNREREDFFLYIGRLSEEKGIEILLKASEDTKWEIYIGGDGNLKDSVISACQRNPRIHYLGILDQDSVREWMSRCSAVIFPSLWYEGMPMTIIEAFALGTPVLASNLGAMSSMIKDNYNGFHFSAGNPVKLAEKMEYWRNLGKSDKIQISTNARACFEAEFTADRNRELLLHIYKGEIESNRVK
jgi:glycosyltransferase involved in cell wall biosynthesis